jgi:hypothetical protein
MEEKIKRHRRTKAEMLQEANSATRPVGTGDKPAEIIAPSDFTERHKKIGRGRPTKSELDYKLDDVNRLSIKCDKDAVNSGIKPKIYQNETTPGKDGVKSIWYYDWNKNPTTGLIATENIFPKDFDDTLPDDDSLPLTKRTFLNPANGKYVGYGRAVQLGLYKPEAGSGKRGRPKKA